MKQKIELITFHKAISYGAGLQAYALQRYLNNKGYETEIIDYVPKRFSRNNVIFCQPTGTSFVKKIVKSVPYAVCKGTGYAIVKRFNKKYLKLTSKSFYAAKELNNYDFKCNLYITGSDQVWNLKFDSFDNIRPFLLDFTKETDRRIAYAASIGMTDFCNEQAILNGSFKQLLNRYYKISVREDSAVKLLDSIGIHSQEVLDPTFLIDGDEWRTLAKMPKSTKKYIFIYGLYRNKKLYAFAHKLAGRLGLSLVNMADSYDFCKGAKNKIIVTHEQLLGYIANAECVVTDSFHGAAISLNMNRPLYIFPALRYNSRLQSLVKLMGIEERYIDKDQNVMEIEMNYSAVNVRLQRERNKAYTFLAQAIGD